MGRVRREAGDDQPRHHLRIEAADQHRAADTGVAGQRKEARHALGIGALPVRFGIGVRRHAADVVAGADSAVIVRM